MMTVKQMLLAVVIIASVVQVGVYFDRKHELDMAEKGLCKNKNTYEKCK